MCPSAKKLCLHALKLILLTVTTWKHAEPSLQNNVRPIKGEWALTCNSHQLFGAGFIEYFFKLNFNFIFMALA
jgi:hypothetical protein